uniref:Uncharacterized protein n=1 Tax=Anguilla anguilla TaxID=7936 RepID=A0A0E9SMG5_ANGAN
MASVAKLLRYGRECVGTSFFIVRGLASSEILTRLEPSRFPAAYL